MAGRAGDRGHEAAELNDASPIRSFQLGGFECSTHRRRDGVRLDLVAATQHDRFAEADYRVLAGHGIRTVRDGARWHLIEAAPAQYDWSSFLPQLEAAERTGTQVIWDLLHYGCPDDVDIYTPEFVQRFARFCGALAAQVRARTDAVPIYCPANEMSYWAWAGGDKGQLNPCSVGRGGELKRQLVRAYIAAIDAIRAVDPRARFITAEPLVNVVSPTDEPDRVAYAEQVTHYQYEACDWLSGRAEPELGGAAGYLDIVGLNFYPENQWWVDGPTIPFGHYAFRPLADLLAEVHERYQRPLLISETGAEGSARPSWLHYVFEEVARARARNVPVLGICLYPVLDYPGWENERHCDVGLCGMPDANGVRRICDRTAAELRRQLETLSPAP